MGSSCSKEPPATAKGEQQFSVDPAFIKDPPATVKDEPQSSGGTGYDTVDTPNSNNSCLLAVKFVSGEKITVFKYVSDKDDWPICHEIPIGGIFRTLIVQQYMLFIDWVDAKRICCYDTTTRAIRTLQPFKDDVYLYYFAAVFQDKLYLFADTEDKRKVHVWNPAKHHWSEAPKLNIGREHAAAISHRGHLYVAGGSKGFPHNTELRSVERYEPRSRSWKHCADLMQARCAAGLVSAGAFLYIVGGECSEIATNMVERYDEQLNKWTQLMCMEIPKNYPACAYYNNCLLTCGGPTMLCKTVEVFNEAENKWHRRNSMPTQGPYSYVIVTPSWLRQLESLN